MQCPKCSGEVEVLGKLPDIEILNVEDSHNWVCEKCFKEITGEEPPSEDFQI